MWSTSPLLPRTVKLQVCLTCAPISSKYTWCKCRAEQTVRTSDMKLTIAPLYFREVSYHEKTSKYMQH